MNMRSVKLVVVYFTAAWLLGLAPGVLAQGDPAPVVAAAAAGACGPLGLGAAREWMKNADAAPKGGFRPLALMEDVDLVRRIGRGRLRMLKATAVTSAERYRRDGFWLRPIRNQFCLLLWFIGVPPRRIMRIYYR